MVLAAHSMLQANAVPPVNIARRRIYVSLYKTDQLVLKRLCLAMVHALISLGLQMPAASFA